MSQKRMPSDSEIASLADKFRELWKPGEEIRPWLREQRELMLELVHGKWSWASMAKVLTTAGITYRTGKPWSDGLLRKDFSRAQSPLKGYARRQKVELLDTGMLAQFELSARSDSNEASTGATSDKIVVPEITVRALPNPKFKPAVVKPYKPPTELTTEERVTIDENRKRILGY